MKNRDIFPTRGEERINDKSDLLEDMYAEIATAFDELWRNTRHSRYVTDAELTEMYAAALKRELTFADKVFAAANDVADGNANPVVLLFDVDQTIVKKEDSGVDTVRPALPIVVEKLQQVLGSRLEVGLLTSRGQSHLDQELEQPTYLDPIIETVNPAFVLSSRQSKPPDQIDAYLLAGHTRTMHQLGNFLNPDLIKDDEFDTIKAIATVTASRTGWMDKKLPILKGLVEQHKDRGFVYIDDAVSASVINPNFAPNNLRCVQVYDDAAFHELS